MTSRSLRHSYWGRVVEKYLKENLKEKKKVKSEGGGKRET